MEKKAKKSFLARSPAWALALLTFFVTVGLFALPVPESIVKSIEVYIHVNALLFIIYLILLPTACFIICKVHPKSIWYTPLICNALMIIMLILVATSNSGLTKMIFLSGCIVLSVIGAFIGAKIGRPKTNIAA